MENVSVCVFNYLDFFNSNPSLISVENAKAYVDRLFKDRGAPSCQTVTVDPSGKIIIQGFDSFEYFKEHYPEIDPGPDNDFGDDILWDLKLVLSPESSEIVCDYVTHGAPWNDQSQTFQIEYLGYPTASQ